MINITVSYAAGDHIWSVSTRLTQGATVADAIKESGFLGIFPEKRIEQLACGIFSRRVTLNELAQDGDRIEIYRGLIFDPKQSRRRRAIHRQKVRNIKKKMPINDLTV
jgi:putative ubiquitin-RnfH superfamily antitoxin RatB of RatAB toxin-antitoxin module